jgi:hypothetical protein
MKYRFLIKLCIIIIIFSLLTGCANSESLEESAFANESNSIVAYDFEPLTFYSFDDFIDSIVEIDAGSDMYNLSDLAYYYTPSESIAGITLETITVNERYVCLYYYLEDLSNKNYPSADDEEIARIANTVKLEWVRNADGESLLSNTINQLSLKELTSGIYYCDISYPTRVSVILSKSLFWVHDGYMFNLDIPQSMYETLNTTYNTNEVFTEITKIRITD